MHDNQGFDAKIFMITITPIPAFTDNYIWAIQADMEGSAITVVDPGDAKAVLDYLQANQLQLKSILITHWHPDHIGGIDTLRENFPDVAVIGPNSPHIPQITVPLKNGESIDVFGTTFQCLEIPGHTLDHIAFYSEAADALFCGDTLFAGGCGRVFEGDPAMMLNSLNILKSLPAKTLFYCAHEYTLSNLRFAIEVEPDNSLLQQRLIACQQQRQNDEPTVPACIQDELDTNPFLRTDEPAVITQALNQGASSSDNVDVFACLREWKNNF